MYLPSPLLDVYLYKIQRNGMRYYTSYKGNTASEIDYSDKMIFIKIK